MKKKLLFSLLFCAFLITAEAQWIQQGSGFPTPNRGIRYIHAVDANVVWAIGYDGSMANAPQIQEFTRTSNGGSKWKARSIPGYPQAGLAMICAVDSLNAWIPVWEALGGGWIIRTSDGGLNWTKQTTAAFSAPGGFPNVVHFWNLNDGFCMGDPNGGFFEIYTTTNGGNTWTRVPQANIPANLSGEYGTTGLYDVVGNIIWFTTGKGRVYKSIDKGHHWTVSATPDTSNQMIISFKDAFNGTVRSNLPPYDAYYTGDGGLTWQNLPYSGNFYPTDFTYIPGTTNTLISAGSDYSTPFMGISTSINGGMTWYDYPGTTPYQYLCLSFVSNNCGWAGGFNSDSLNGGFWKYIGNDFA